MVVVKPHWAEFSTGRRFMAYVLEIIFPEGGESTAEAKKLYIDDKEVEPDFDRLFLEARRVVVYDVTEVVKIYT